MSEERLISGARRDGDEELVKLRPQRLEDFTGQKIVCENLKIFITAALARGEALDHVLLSGPPGLGKTTLAQIVAHELDVDFRSIAAPTITKIGDLAAILTTVQPNSVLFIDEIHRLLPTIEETLYSAMEDFQLDVLVGSGPAATTVRVPLQPFTLIGATTRSGLLSQPLRDRFGIPLRLDFYDPAELKKIVVRGAGILNIGITDDGAIEIAKRSRGTPRVAGRLLKRVRDFAVFEGRKEIDAALADRALQRLDVDKQGLDMMDRRYLTCIAQKYAGGPVGADTLAAALSEERDTIEEVIEPYLLQQGYIQRTPRGRMLSAMGFKHLGLSAPTSSQNDLFSAQD
ncbi:MAG: Holliday junction branch migration DNA helicase RuvB [Alphaproteobacteria bacterium]|nr:Holliday junction branch migration DNA helicase RuvB [Alphaproteobacteria bacterium]